MTVQELIDKLNEIEDKSKEVLLYNSNEDTYIDINLVTEFSDFIELY